MEFVVFVLGRFTLVDDAVAVMKRLPGHRESFKRMPTIIDSVVVERTRYA